MIARLPSWALHGGALLATVAGMVNAVGWLGLYHQAVTHMTGTATLLGIAAARQDAGQVLHFGVMLVAFVAGCAASGFIVGDSTLRLGRRYGVALALESLLLFAAVPVLLAGHEGGLWLVAAAAGLQNAMAATFSGAVVRTTHMSGIITDLGTFLGQWARGDRVDRRRVTLYLALLGGFLVGGVLATWFWPTLTWTTLLIPAVLTGMVAAGYAVGQAVRRRDL